ncbi:hypothetical protein OZ411_06220 [Bradyrhizobium sp. Arg237L]|uniref:hypothetical protein n=1 Tax=Bradyrhizobium sp. Arg237L TaxID=3003352 RepID=UPI00249DA569|nr:hypothetical protein [Bradyrhizobium sp. Arg237L]MDI4232409.1 hypothetical protein [Bradyrhizobium sp. Arg237L]
MAKDYPGKQQAAEQHPEPRERKQETRTPASLPEPALPLLNEGLERVRESHC